MTDSYSIKCDCGSVEMVLTGAPRVRGHCHCQACRTLLDVPYHSVTAWNADQLEVTNGVEALISFQHPNLKMKKIFCSSPAAKFFSTPMRWTGGLSRST